LLIARPNRAKTLLDAIASERLEPTVLNASQAAFLRKHSDAALKQLANQILPPPPSRESVIAAFRPALSLTGNSSRGHELYVQRCISCHRAGNEGSAVGPDFATMKNAGKEKLLLNILDPNREVAPQYLSFLIETKDGQSVLGIVASDQPSGITFRQAFGRETVIPRAQIRRMSSQGQSLMPEGLEEKLTPRDLADLIAFVESIH
jgi:putative heme-binding domain-containing protein